MLKHAKLKRITNVVLTIIFLAYTFSLGAMPVLAVPATPTNFKATIVETNKIKLTWDDVAGETDYQIRWGTTAANLYYLTTRPADTTNYTLPNPLTEGDTRYFNLVARDSSYNPSPPTPTVSATIPINPPTNLTATAATDSLKINLAWQDHTGIETNYIVEKSQGDDQHFSVLATLPANTVTYTDTTDLVADTTYYYKVRGKLNDTTFTEYTNTASATPTYKYTGVNPKIVRELPMVGENVYVPKFSKDGNYLYIGSDKNMQIADVHNPNNPLIISSVKLEDKAYDIIEDDKNYVYVSNGKNISIINITDKFKPEIVKVMETPDYSYGLYISDNKLFIACYDAGLITYDITYPIMPVVISIFDTPGVSRSIVVNNGKAVIADGTGILLLNISDVKLPIIIKTIETEGSVIDVAIQNNYAYVITNENMYIFEINNPDDIKFYTHDLTEGEVNMSIKILNNYLYIGSFAYSYDYNGFAVYDISDPFYPKYKNFQNHHGHTYYNSIDISCHNILGIAEMYGGLVLTDVNNPLAPIVTSLISSTDYISSINIKGEYLYVATYSAYQSKLYIYKIINQKQSYQVGAINTNKVLDSTFYGNDYIVLADTPPSSSSTYSSIKIIDIRNPLNPSLLSTIDASHYPRGVTVKNNLLFIANTSEGLLIYDINNPQNPIKKSTLNTNGSPSAVAVSGIYAYIANTENMRVANVANLSAPYLYPNVITPSVNNYIRDVAIQGTFAFLTADANGTLVVDINVPNNPQLIKTIVPKVSSCRNITIVQNKAYVNNFSSSADYNGIQIIDVTNPSQSTEIGYLPSSDQSEKGIAILDDSIYFSGLDPLLAVADLYYDYLKVEQTSSCGGTEGCTSANHGQEITYTLKITNPTPYTFTGSNNILSNEIPDGTTYVTNSATGEGQYSNGKITWNLGQVNPNDTREVTFKVEVD